ncbi:MAG: hypothetical protein NC313_00680 [Butyrivibrio sp.]|nr:hypothetical protein [Butyrivibrio sp.]
MYSTFIQKRHFEEIRKWLYSFILVLALSFQVSIAAHAADFAVTEVNAVIYTATPSGCYTEPDASSVLVATLPVGTPVQVTGITSNGWLRIEAGGIFYISGNAMAQNTAATPMPSVATVSSPQYTDSVEYTITSMDSAYTARADAISKHASHIVLHNKGVDNNTLLNLFYGVPSEPVSDYAMVNIYGVSISYTSKDATVSYRYLSTIEEELYTDATVAQLVPQFNTGSTYDKIKAVHDYICNTVSYSHETAAGAANFQSAYDALYYKTTVCSGYALLFQKFMDYMGIPCYVARGTMNGVGHAWNVVNVDGQWYYIDCTNDDQDYGIIRNFFLKGASFAGPVWGNIPISATDYKR